MKNLKKTEYNFLNGVGTTITGDIFIQTPTVISCTVQGYVKSTTELIVDNGCIEGDITADTLTMDNGTIVGDIHAKVVNLGEHAQVTGNITADVLSIYPGGIINGTCSILNCNETICETEDELER